MNLCACKQILFALAQNRTCAQIYCSRCNDWSKACGSKCIKIFNRQNQTGKGQWAKTGISDETDAHQGGADKTGTHQGGADGTGAHQGGADETPGSDWDLEETETQEAERAHIVSRTEAGSLGGHGRSRAAKMNQGTPWAMAGSGSQ